MTIQRQRVVLVTGGTGSFGQAFVRALLGRDSVRVRVFSRDEHKQQAMMRAGLTPSAALTYILGDVRDVDKLAEACDGVTDIVHAAALKTVPGGEAHTDEFVATNVNGSANVIRAAILRRVPRSLLISSDKACQPVNQYGKTKAVAEGLFVQANARGVSRGARFACVRGGNVWMSNGSVARVWREQARAGQPLTVTDPDATRFHMEMDEWCGFVWAQLATMSGGEVIVPRVPAWRLGDLAEAFGLPVEVSGPRGGDKQHEIMVAREEAARTLETPAKYIIQPDEGLRGVWNYQPPAGAYSPHPAPVGFEFTSATAERMTREQLHELARGALK